MNVKLITKALHALSLLSEEDVTTVMNLRALSEDERELLITVLEPQKGTTKRASKKSSSPQREYDHCLRCGTTKRDSSHKDTSSPDYHEFQSSKDIDFCVRCKGASYVHPIHHDETLGGYHPFESSKKSSRSASKSPRASSLAQQIKRATDNGEKPSPVLCAACGNDEDFADHFKPSPHYHEFDAGKSSTSAAQPARGKSSTKGGAGSGTVNSETEKEDVSNVHHAGG